MIRGWLVRKSFAHQSVKVHMGMSIIRKEEVDGGFITKPQVIENGEVKYANKVMCWLYRFCEQEIIIMLITSSKTYCSICIPLMFKQSLNMQNV